MSFFLDSLILHHYYRIISNQYIVGLVDIQVQQNTEKYTNHTKNVFSFLTSALVCCANCTYMCIYSTYRTCACILHVFTFLVRQSDGGGRGGANGQLSAGKTNKLRAMERAWSPGTLRHILSTSLLGQHQTRLQAPHRSVAT